jgi:SAM-dependent methyltransferase
VTVALPPLAANAWLRYDGIRGMIDATVGREARLGDVLEIGAGQGGVGARLAVRSRYTGVDLDTKSLAVARRRIEPLGVGARILDGAADDVLAPDERFDWVCAFEVIEHIDDDRAALASWAGRLRPGGHLLISTPAGADRYGSFDRLAGHFRRYDPAVLAGLLTEVGLREVQVRCVGAPLGYVLEAARNVLATRRGFPAHPAGLVEPAGESTAHPAGEDGREEMQQATLGSARLFQPGDALGPAIAAATWPFRLAQRRLPDRGTGLVACGRLPA